MDILSIIEKLSETPAPSGFEHTSAKKTEGLFSRVFDTVERDRFGNVYGIRKSGISGAKCLLLDAHSDEIGLITTGSEDGFLTFNAIGGVDPRILPASEVAVLTSPPRYGVICASPPHLQTAEEMENSLKIEDLYIDVGAESDEVHAGTPVVFSSECVKLKGSSISCRALDDRASLAALLYAVSMLKNKKIPLDIVLVASTQEELGCRGAKIAGYKINPDFALVMDVTHGSTPGVDKGLTFDCGSGTAIGVGANITKKLSDKLISIAKEKRIPHTIEVCPRDSGTNASSIQTAREGIATALLSIPLKYMHTPVETLKKADIESAARLTYEFILALASGGVFRD